jgi:hypothetical protein
MVSTNAIEREREYLFVLDFFFRGNLPGKNRNDRLSIVSDYPRKTDSHSQGHTLTVISIFAGGCEKIVVLGEYFVQPQQ